MTPLTLEDLQSGSVRAFATDLLTHSTQRLSIRPDSRCHFFDPFVSGDFQVQLRLDWNDLDSHGNPMLDADFYSLATGKMDKTMKQHPAHHTESDDGHSRIYKWVFKDIERQLQIMLALSKSVSDTLGIRETVAHRIVPVHDLGRAASRACGSTEQVARADGSRGTSLAGRRASAAPHRPPLSHTVRPFYGWADGNAHGGPRVRRPSI